MSKKDWVKLLSTLLAASFIVTLLASGQLEIKIVQSLLFFVVLLGAYKMGSSMGAVCGSLAGMILTIVSGNIAYLAALCMGGLLAGFFSVLGKIGSITAFIFGMSGIVAFYSYNLLFVNTWQVVAASLVFFLFPSHLLRGKTRKIRYGKKESEILLTRLMQMAKSFTLLSQYFKEGVIMDESPSYFIDSSIALQAEYLERYRDSQRAIGIQFAQVGRMLEKTVNQMRTVKTSSANQYKNVIRAFKLHHLEIRQLLFLSYEEGRSEAYMKIRTKKNQYISTKEAADYLSFETGKRFRISGETPTVINKKFSEVKFEEEPSYQVLYGITKATKNGEEISGDSFLVKNLAEGQLLFCLSDGMGSGKKAYLESQMALNLVEELLSSGFELRACASFINHVLLFNRKDQHPTTLDLCLIDLYTGVAKLIKMGAPKSYCKRKEEVQGIGHFQVPLGMLNEEEISVEEIKLKNGDLLFMLTDGVIDQLKTGRREEHLASLISQYKSVNARQASVWLMDKVLPEQENAEDDLSILVLSIWKK